MISQSRSFLFRIISGLFITLLAVVTTLTSHPAAAQEVALSRAGLPDKWVIVGIKPTERLSLRSFPGTMFNATGTVRLNESVQNIGCADVFGARWCKVQKLTGDRAQGFLRSRYLAEGAARPDPTPDDSFAGGPDFWQVHGLRASDRLNIRATPSAQARILGTLRNGERVRNQGCRMTGNTRWCKITALSGSKVTGYVSGRYLREAGGPPPRPPTDDDLAGGPDVWRVRGLPPGDMLNVRQAPTTQSRVIATLVEGERVRNLGCEMRGGTRWCLIRSMVGIDVTGYVNGRYLRE